MIKAIVFDLDGTLYDRYSTLRAVAYLLYSERREWVPKGMPAKELGRQLVKFDHRGNYFGGWPAVAQRMKNAGALAPETDVNEFARVVVADIARTIVPYPFTHAMLASLRKKGYRLGMITNGIHETQWEKLDRLHLRGEFETVQVSGDVGADKPSPIIFKACADAMRLKPEEIVYVGDNPQLDVLGAYNGGFTPIWVKTSVGWGFPKIPRTPYEINDVSELEAMMDVISAADQ